MPTEVRRPSERWGGRNAPKFRVGQFVKGVGPSIASGRVEGRHAADWMGGWDPKYKYYHLNWLYSVRDERGVLHSIPEESLVLLTVEAEKKAILREIERLEREYGVKKR